MYRLTHSRSTAASCWSGERADYQQTSSEYGMTTAGRETAMYIQGGQKRGHRLMTIILSNLNRCTVFFFTGRFLGKFAIKCRLNIRLVSDTKFESKNN